MDPVQSIVIRSTGAGSAEEAGVLQSLWSGYGSIVRYALKGAVVPSVIVKHVCPPDAKNHPRGWNTDFSHRRKLKSYAVETAWYRDYAQRCAAVCRVPHCLALETQGNEVVMVLEDLDAAGYPERRSRVSEAELKACLLWLAQFHAFFLQEDPKGLWPNGTYWHLETRPDELMILAGEDPELHSAAPALDAKLRASSFQTLVHGDAKLANFCFSADGNLVAAVDFQYVGGGCGMQDLAYFIGSCFGEDECARLESSLLDLYFSFLRKALVESRPAVDVYALETEWRALYPVAWTDFHRFLKGWSPGHWKIHGYSEKLARSVLSEMKGK